MSLSNLAPLDSTSIATINAACKFFGFLHANPRWSLKIQPDEVELIYFIVLNYSEQGKSIGSSDMSISSSRILASTKCPFPNWWLTNGGQARKSGRKAARVFLRDAKRIFMTDAFYNWKRQVFATSILDLPNELLQLIAGQLPTESLIRLCQSNRRLSKVIGFKLWRPLDRTIKALIWSLNNTRPTVYEKAVEQLSNMAGSMGDKFTWRLFHVINTNNIHMLEFMASKGGFGGELYRQFLIDTLFDNLEQSRPKHLSVKEVLKLGADPNCSSDWPTLRDLDLGRIPILLVAICGCRALCADILERSTEHEHDIYKISKRPGSVDNVRLLLEHGADPNIHISDKTSPLHVTVCLCNSKRKSEIVTELIKYGANVNAIGPNGKTPLHMAVGRNNCVKSHSPCKATIKVLLQATGIDLDRRDENGRTPLSIAAGRNTACSTWFVERMLQNSDVDINSQDIHGRTVLYHSVASRNKRVTELLLSQTNINPNLNTTKLPLFFAVSQRMERMVEILLSENATDPNRKDGNGRLALTLPTTRHIIKLLIKAGAQLDIRDSTGLTAQETISRTGINLEQLMHPRKRKRAGGKGKGKGKKKSRRY
ncbi:F-box domain, cyclin-like [Penicillium roqueforti FM164]|uniref:F-box domain, cyclin-like n=1 Tax=Penicillium roqueforti (strain FM164) TaxID=1365484 RepID=W6Q449_PENRF|nr:F-box domain, cyclin-like [Penicillium roqueforti FM164]